MKKKTSSKKTKSRVSKNEITIRVEPQQMLPAVPTVEQLAEPMHDGKKLAISKTWVSESQIMRMVQRTPKEHIYNRPAKGGGTWSYVTGAYVEKVLNFVFGFLWDFEVISYSKEGDAVIVLGKLTVKDGKGNTIVKSQFGRADIKFKRGSKEPLDYGNDLKAATTDALKKCASLLGIASDVYGKMEYKQESGKDPQESHPVNHDEPTIAPGDASPKTLKPGQVVGPDGSGVYICSDTGDIISEAEYAYSMKMFGRALSRDAQKNHKPKR